MVARQANVGEDAHGNGFAGNNKTMGIGSIVELRKGGNGKISYGDRFVGPEWNDQIFVQCQLSFSQGTGGDVNRKFVFLGKSLNSVNMIPMFMSHKNGFDFFYGKSQPLHPFFGFTTGYSAIHQHSLFVVADVITIAVAAGI